MKGSEKQMAWANELVEKAISTLEWARENPADAGKADPETWKKGIDLLIGRIRSAEYAGDVIDSFSRFNFGADQGKNFMSVVGAMNSRVIKCKF